MDICYAVYFNRIHDDMFETFLKTFRKHNKNALLQVHINPTDSKSLDFWTNNYDVDFVIVPEKSFKNRRMLCKIESLQSLIRNCLPGDRIMCSDVDVYFLDDPFKAFEEFDFDIGLIRRPADEEIEIYAGMLFIKASLAMYQFSKFTITENRCAFWEDLKYTLVLPTMDRHFDWFIDQDFWRAIWTNRAEVSEKFNLMITSIDRRYNFCPDTFLIGYKKANELIKDAYDKKSVVAIHLKSRSKMCLYDGYFEDAVTKNLCSSWDWEKDGK